MLPPASGGTSTDAVIWRRMRTTEPDRDPSFALVSQSPRLPRHNQIGDLDGVDVRVPVESMKIGAGPGSPAPSSRARPKIRIMSRPRQPKSVRAIPAIPLDPDPDSRPRHHQPDRPHQRQRRVKRSFRITVRSPLREIWGLFPTPLDHKRPVPRLVSEWLITSHRWFKPQLVHQTLYNMDGCFEPALQYVYRTFMDAAQIRRLYADIHTYIADVSDDVFGIDPDRYLKIRPDQMIQLENPSGFPVFIHQSPVVDPNMGSEPATMSVYANTTTKPSELKLVLNDAALFLWGYTREQWESHQVHDVDDPSVPDKSLPFFFSLFAPDAVFSILALNLGIFYLQCKFASFRCHIMRRDGKQVPVLCRFTTYLHAKHAHVSQFAFTDIDSGDPDHANPLAASSISNYCQLPELDLPVLHNLPS